MTIMYSNIICLKKRGKRKKSPFTTVISHIWQKRPFAVHLGYNQRLKVFEAKHFRPHIQQIVQATNFARPANQEQLVSLGAQKRQSHRL